MSKVYPLKIRDKEAACGLIESTESDSECLKASSLKGGCCCCDCLFDPHTTAVIVQLIAPWWHTAPLQSNAHTPLQRCAILSITDPGSSPSHQSHLTTAAFSSCSSFRLLMDTLSGATCLAHIIAVTYAWEALYAIFFICCISSSWHISLHVDFT